MDALNRFQALRLFHPFTCPNHPGKRDNDRALIATRDGWRCRHCTYTQDWAHSWMVTVADEAERLESMVRIGNLRARRKNEQENDND
ncbi:hypothetical protein [Bradyrhizobium diazoefficiens]|uniref:hypothetical protein n=1 Tax=Bradyrhizobium diazoefficiens TaxID=1355477 RepID=UPI0035199649